MKRITKLRIIWTVITIVATVLGYLMLLHGGVYGEAAERNNQSALIYQLEVYVGQLLTWPVTIYGWLHSLYSSSNMLGWEVLAFQLGGYALLYKIHAKFSIKNT